MVIVEVFKFAVWDAVKAFDCFEKMGEKLIVVPIGKSYLISPEVLRYGKPLSARDLDKLIENLQFNY